MFPENRGRTHIGDLAPEGGFDRLGLAQVRHRDNYAGAFEDLLDAHRYCPGGDIVESLKPSLTELLLSAFFVEVDNEVGFFGVEVGGRVVKGEMAVFSYAYQCDIYGMVGDNCAEPAALGLQIICIAINKICCFQSSYSVDKSLIMHPPPHPLRLEIQPTATAESKLAY